MAKKLSCEGKWSWWNLSEYSKYFTTRKTRARKTVAPIHILNRGKLPILQEAQASTMVMELVISTAVLKVPKGALRTSLESPPSGGQCGAPMRISTQLEKSAPKSITSLARKSQMPNFPFGSPVTGCGFT